MTDGDGLIATNDGRLMNERAIFQRISIEPWQRHANVKNFHPSSNQFGAEGEPARNVSYRAKVTGQASEAQIRELMSQTDRVGEIQNTLRLGTPVTLSGIEAVTV